MRKSEALLHHQLSSLDITLVTRARQMLTDAIRANLVTPAELVSIALVGNALSRLPRATAAGAITITIIGPTHVKDDTETNFTWTISIEDETVALECGGYFQPSTGGDSFTTLLWASMPGAPPEFQDYMDQNRIVPNLQSLMTGIPDLLTAPGYRLSVDDQGNPWLEDDSQDEGSESASADEYAAASESEVTLQITGWSVEPIDELEQGVALTVDVDTVNGRAAQFGHGLDECGSCQCDLSQRGLAVDGRIKGELLWDHFCIPCFSRKGAGIGWGSGQLYAKQSSAEWRLVAGFEPENVR